MQDKLLNNLCLLQIPKTVLSLNLSQMNESQQVKECKCNNCYPQLFNKLKQQSTKEIVVHVDNDNNMVNENLNQDAYPPLCFDEQNNSDDQDKMYNHPDSDNQGLFNDSKGRSDNRVSFIFEQESVTTYENLIKILDQSLCRGLIIVKLDNIKSLRALDNHLESKEYRYLCVDKKIIQTQFVDDIEIIISHSLENIPVATLQMCNVIIHLEFIPDFTSYLEDLNGVNQHCLSYVFFSKHLFMRRRNQILQSFIDQATFDNLMNQILPDQAINPLFDDFEETIMIRINQLTSMFKIDEKTIVSIFDAIQKQEIIHILNEFPTQLRVSILKVVEQKEQFDDIIYQGIKSYGRKLISLRQCSKTHEHYQVDLIVLAKALGLPLQHLIEILNQNKLLFSQKEFFDTQIQYKINSSNSHQIERIKEECYKEINKLTNKQLEEIESIYLVSQRYRERNNSLSFDPKQHLEINKFKQLMQEYQLGDVQIQDQLLPYESLQTIKKKVQLKKDIQVQYFGFIFLESNGRSLGQLGCQNWLIYTARDITISKNSPKLKHFQSFKEWKDMKLFGKYSNYNFQELLRDVNEVNRNQSEAIRTHGWLAKKKIKP